ncbi:MAG TPA: caspase family protein [Xanthobacteraceae bacterium]|jgi:hypothetical protein
MAGEAGERRVALVVGNSAYAREAQLPNPQNDASDTATALRRLGFSVRLGLNLTREKLLKNIADFARDADGAETALFYYAGHGLQLDGTNYLVPTDADIVSEVDVAFHTQKLNDILDMMMRASRASIVILDACRNNPFTRSLKRTMSAKRSAAVGEGLATVQLRPDGEALIAYSTQPDNTAEDGVGERNSPFTTALLRYIELPGVSIEEVLKRIGRAVKDATNGQQIPWYNSSLFYEFQFNPGPAAGQEKKQAGTPEHPWLLLKDSPSPNLIQSFVTNFPGDPYVSEAKQRLAELEAEAWSRIRTRQTFSDVEAFLSQYPQGHYAGDAKQRLAALRRYALASLTALGLLTGLFSGLSLILPTLIGHDVNSFPWLSYFFIISLTYRIFLWWNSGILLFGCAIAFGLSRWWPQTWRGTLSFITITLLAWLLAHEGWQVMSHASGLQFESFARLKMTEHEVPLELQSFVAQYESFTLLLVTGIASAIGAAVTLVGAAIMSRRMRDPGLWVVAIIGVTLSAVPMTVLGAYGYSDRTAMTALFVTWQVWMAGCIAWAHVRGLESARGS